MFDNGKRRGLGLCRGDPPDWRGFSQSPRECAPVAAVQVPARRENKLIDEEAAAGQISFRFEVA
jgi:hypothetical protein